MLQSIEVNIMVWRTSSVVLLLLCSSVAFGFECTNSGDANSWLTFMQQAELSILPSSSPFKAQEFPLKNVTLTDPSSPQMKHQAMNLEYLLMLDSDALLWSFRKTANLSTPGTPYGGWEGPDVEVRGEFMGHYLSAAAMMWASTGNQTLYDKMLHIIDALKEVQDVYGTGYLSAFPVSFFDRLESFQNVWVPYYTIHKIMAGLYDQHRFTGNVLPLQMAVAMADYFAWRIDRVIANQTIAGWNHILNREFGGMNEVLYNIYQVTQNPKYLKYAHLFDKPCFMGPLALQTDDLTNIHANTHIPEVIGAARRYEVVGDVLYQTVASYFFDLLNSTRIYATGGHNDNEFWGAPHRLGDSLNSANEESCTMYNTLKLVRHLFTWSQDAHLGDFYERGLNNGVLGILKAPGVFIYLLPLGAGSNKGVSPHGWGTPFDSFWCCYGTGVESMSKLADSIYFNDLTTENSVLIMQYVSSALDAGNFILHQAVDISQADANYKALTSRFQVTASPSAPSVQLKLRVPEWTTSSYSAKLNDVDIISPIFNNGYLVINRTWSSNDILEVSFPMTFRTEKINDDRAEFQNLFAVLYGPFVLAGKWEYTDTKAALCLAHEGDISSQFIPINEDNKLLVSFAAQDDSGFVRHSGYVGWISPPVSLTDKEDSTFRMIGHQDGSVSFESFNYIGHYITNVNGRLTIVKNSSDEAAPRFMQVKALNGKSGGFSLVTVEDINSFMVVRDVSGRLEVHFAEPDGTVEFKNQATFKITSSNAKYHPLSFRTAGCERDLVFFPLNEMTDERYSVYFTLNV
eukprot:TRINITY_DN3897_c0_g2_i1.p1 TRINITY_DN3897_c0_g2~~TRINITY_DN3897_c0_g2_i1.p1  ORF type:complete len:799 (-),score=203.23 TRINITY_DN3897_c0_g2_i1:161-2557(-)